MDHPTPAVDPSATWLELGALQRLLLDSHPGTVLCLDPGGRIRWINAAGAERLGHEAEALVGSALAGTLIAPEALSERAAQLSVELVEQLPADASVLGARLRRGAVTDEHDWVLRHKDGSPQPTRLAVAALRDPRGEITGLIAVQPAPRAEARPQLHHHDDLTGLPTRAVLADRAEMAFQHATRQHRLVALMVVEIIGFDALCEEYGHSVGDDLLRATASRLHFELRKTDTAVRLDGGQFATMLVDLHHADEAVTVAEKIRQALSARVNVGVAIIPLSVRIGMAMYPTHGDQLLPLLEAAEDALEDVPHGGGGVACTVLAEA